MVVVEEMEVEEEEDGREEEVYRRLGEVVGEVGELETSGVSMKEFGRRRRELLGRLIELQAEAKVVGGGGGGGGE